jgi:hypothetical protein
MARSGSEVASRREEVDLLRTQVDRLHELVAELLAKNQHLREALEEGSIPADASRSVEANETVRQLIVNEMKFTASFIYELGHWKHGKFGCGKIKSDD